MNENEIEPVVFRFIMTVDGSPFAKFVTAEEAVTGWQEVASTTEDKIELASIH